MEWEPASVVRRPWRGERGISVIEVIIAAFVLGLVVVGATAVFSSSSSATSKARVRDKQSALANEVLAKMQADSSWALECRRQQTPFNPGAPDCSLDSWMRTQPHIQGMGVVRESNGVAYRFTISAVATGVDLPADGMGVGADADGLVPDVYRLRVTIAPTPELLQQVEGLRPVTLQLETNPSLRMQTGRVTVNACLVLNQVDERMAAGSCNGSGELVDMLPPAALDTSSAAAMRSTCQHPSNGGGSDRRDCMPYRCATRVVALADPSQCNQPGWNMNVLRHPDLEEFTGVQIRPAAGTVTLRSRTGGRTWTQELLGGTAQFTELPVGQYVVQFNPPGYRPWKSKSVPASGEVAVEAGLNSRAVLMYRPLGRATVRAAIEAEDVSGPPWLRTPLPGFPNMRPDGTLVNGGRERFFLTPVPQGRLLNEDRPFVDVPRTTATEYMEFQNVEPGLYSFELGNADYDAFDAVTPTGGFIYVYPDGRVYYGEDPGELTFKEGLCASDVRSTWIAGGPLVSPETGTLWEPEPCSSPSGPAPPGGGGGAGAS